MSERKQSHRWRCLEVGCNPVLDKLKAEAHRNETQHRVAKWPVRSAEGKRRAKVRNRTGYYDQYNVGDKAPGVRFGSGDGYSDNGWDGSGEMLGQS